MMMGDALSEARKSLARQTWSEAYTCLSAADHERGLEPEDLKAVCEGFS